MSLGVFYSLSANVSLSVLLVDSRWEFRNLSPRLY